jgi:putative ABC transport system permease protein
MVNSMVWNNLTYRKTRTVLSVVAVALEVLLILSTVGLVRGLVNDNVNRARGIGADIIVKAPGTKYISVMGGAPMPVTMGDLLAKEPHVTAVAPVFVISPDVLSTASGIDESFRNVTGGFKFLEGRDLKSGYEILVDSVYARDKHSKIGDEVELMAQKFLIVGIVQSGKGARMYIPMATAQYLGGAPGKASIFYVRVDDHANIPAALDAINALLPGYNIMSMERLTSMMTNMEGYPVNKFMVVMISISVSVGFLVIFLAMYMAVLERTREIGILKSLGGSKAYIANLIMREVVIITLIGIIVGIGAGLLLQTVVQNKWPSLTVEIPLVWVLWAAVIAVGGSIVGAGYPALRAAQQDPIAALAYE